LWGAAIFGEPVIFMIGVAFWLSFLGHGGGF